jgi:hypothetical protein
MSLHVGLLRGVMTDEHYVATKLFVKKEHRKMFMTFSTDEAS